MSLACLLWPRTVHPAFCRKRDTLRSVRAAPPDWEVPASHGFLPAVALSRPVVAGPAEEARQPGSQLFLLPDERRHEPLLRIQNGAGHSRQNPVFCLQTYFLSFLRFEMAGQPLAL